MDEAKKHLAVAIDTSGRAGSVALGSDKNILGKFVFDGQMRHAAELLPSIKMLIDNAGRQISDITDVYVTDGPGSFTGLRIGITAAKMLALAVDVRIVAVSSLYCTAMNAFDYARTNLQADIERVVAVIDAKRGQFFFAFYEKAGDNWQLQAPEGLKTAEEINTTLNDKKKTLFIGEGLKFYQNKFEAAGRLFMEEEDWAIRAENVYKAAFEKALRGEFECAETLLPRYLRLSDAEENLQKRNESQ